MKKILKSALLMLSGICLLAACADDNDSNPVLPSIDTFKLNTPTFSAGLVDLASSETLRLTWSQPDYGFPAAMNYIVQFSTDGTFATSVAQAEADETGATVADYMEIATPYVTPEASIEASALAKMLVQITKWNEAAVPATQTVYARVLSYINGASNIDSLYSNVVSFNVAPYYVELQDAAPIIWYLIGGTIGDGSWSNSVDGIGVSIQPMFTLAGEEYDKAKGTGKIGYTGYFTASQGFKFILVPGESTWAEQIGTTDGALSPVRNDGGSQNFFVPEDGYYSIILDTSTDCDVTVTKLDAAPDSYTDMFFTGTYGVWDDLKSMSPVHTYAGAVNHDWYYDLDATAGDTEMKFLTDSSWSTNWGAAEFPTGIGVANGANIPVKAGNYRVIFNDITGSYTFIEK
jgi:hypothetical protein